jgi:lipoprotein NlpI
MMISARGFRPAIAGEADAAIADFTRALGASDLAQSLQPTAYFDRALAYRLKGDCAKERPDLDMAIKLKPGYLDAYLQRADAEICLNQNDAAVADITVLLAAKPNAERYRSIGQLQWTLGNFAGAADSFQKGLSLEPQRPYLLLWLGISQARSDSFDAEAFADYYSNMSVDGWPRPIMQFFLGKEKLANVVGDAMDANKDDVAGRKCEADFYGGEWQLTHDDVAASKSLFQDAVNICPKNFEELQPAELELKRLQ